MGVTGRSTAGEVTAPLRSAPRADASAPDPAWPPWWLDLVAQRHQTRQSEQAPFLSAHDLNGGAFGAKAGQQLQRVLHRHAEP
jgi:hypothetical protein